MTSNPEHERPEHPRPARGTRQELTTPPTPAELAPGRITRGHAPELMARALGLLPVAIVFAIVWGAIEGLDELYEAVVSGGATRSIDGPVQSWMVAHREPWLDTAATWYTHLGGKIGMPVLATLAAVALALWWRTRTPVVLMLAATAGSLLLTVSGKTLTDRTRPPYAQAVPPLEHSESFPSGHTLNAFVVATVLGYLVLLYVQSRAARAVAVLGLLLFCLLIAASRVYLGHHWVTDVAAGATAGFAWASAACLGHWVYVRARTKDRAPTVRAVAQEHRLEVQQRRAGQTAG